MENKFIRSNIMMPLLLFFSHRDFYHKKEKNRNNDKEHIDLLRFSYYHNRNKQNPIIKKGGKFEMKYCVNFRF